MIQLPSELLHIIFRFINDNSTLHSLLLVSRRIHAETEAIFYKDIRFIEHPTTSESDMASRFQAFYQRITASNSRLAHHVQRLSVVLHDYPFPDQMQEYFDQIIEQLVHLQTFKFDYAVYIPRGGGFINLPVSSINKFPISLKHFRWDHHLETPDPLITLLHSQQSLERLEVPMFNMAIRLAPSALPCLRALNCAAHTALSILPGRHITHFRSAVVYGGLDWDPAAEALRHIRVFCGRGVCYSLIELARLMPSLEYLELHVDDLHFPNYTLLLRQIHRLGSTRIRYLRITGHHSCTYYSTAPDPASQCFDLLPTLHCVEFQITNDGTYGRWYRRCQSHPLSIDRPNGWDWAEVGDWETGYRVCDMGYQIVELGS